MTIPPKTFAALSRDLHPDSSFLFLRHNTLCEPT